MVRKLRSVFRCAECGFEHPKWAGRCDSCGEWNTLVEELASSARSQKNTSKKSVGESEIVRLSDLNPESAPRIETGLTEFDYVLGGGIVQGSVTIVGGEPGIGKSTLLLQCAARLEARQVPVLYVSGEESVEQTRIRADRLGEDAGAVHVFRHNDMDHLREILDAHRAKHPHALIVTDGVFSMDGDLAPVDVLSQIADHFDAWLMIDDAHGIGVVRSVGASVPLQMGTLSKAIGAYGGYLCASQPVIDLIRTRCRTLIYSTGLPPGVIAAASAALGLIRNDPGYAALPLQKAKAFTKALGLAEAESPIVPIILGSTDRAMEASRLLQEEGFLVIAIRPPTVPDGTARLRATFTAAHEDADIKRLADILKTRVLEQT